MIKIKRTYAEPSDADGVRVLVDRLWPRGISKEKAKLDHWMKEVGPSHELRKSYYNQELTFTQLKEKYMEELKVGKQKEALEELIQIVKDAKHVTLLFSAKNEIENHAVILKEIVEDFSFKPD